MPSKLDINVSAMPDGTYQTILTDPIDDAIVFSGLKDYVSQAASFELVDVDIDTDLTGFVIDNLTPHMNGSVITGVTVYITEVFINLESTASAYYSLSTPWVASGDFEIELDFVSHIVSVGNATLTAGATRGNNSLVSDIDTSGRIRFFAYAGASLQGVMTSNTTGLDDNIQHTVKLRYIGTTASIYIDGVFDKSITWALVGGENIGFFGKRGDDTNFFDGIISNVKLTDLFNFISIEGLD